jgi:hypothetical protein
LALLPSAAALSAGSGITSSVARRRRSASMTAAKVGGLVRVGRQASGGDLESSGGAPDRGEVPGGDGQIAAPVGG